MSGPPVISGLTWEEYLALPDVPHDPRYKHAELVDGELIPVDPPNWLHQHMVGDLVVSIWNWILAGTGRGGVTMKPPVRITTDRAYLPDVAWFREERARPESGRPYLAGPPDLAIEVLSDSTRAFDLVRKREDYARVGVGELWLIDPEGPNALVLRPPAEPVRPSAFVEIDDLKADGVLTSPQLPGLRIPLSELMPG